MCYMFTIMVYNRECGTSLLYFFIVENVVQVYYNGLLYRMWYKYTIMVYNR